MIYTCIGNIPLQVHPRCRHAPMDVYHKKKWCKPVKGTLSEINASQPYLYVNETMDGCKEVKYHVNLIDLLDRVFMNDNLKNLSEEQMEFVTAFFEQAGLATDRIRSNVPNPYSGMDEAFMDLNSFLGGYSGVDYGRYARL